MPSASRKDTIPRSAEMQSKRVRLPLMKEAVSPRSPRQTSGHASQPPPGNPDKTGVDGHTNFG